MLPFRKHRAEMRSAEDLSDDDIVEVVGAAPPLPTTKRDLEIPIEVELDAPRLPRPTPPPRSSRRAVAEAALSALPPKLIDPAAPVPAPPLREPVGPSLAPVAIAVGASEEVHSTTVRIPREAPTTTRRWARTTVAWSAVWVFFGALASMSSAYLLGYVGPHDGTGATNAASPLPPAPPAPHTAAATTSDESALITHAKRDEVRVLTFGDKEAIVFGAVTPPAAATTTAPAAQSATSQPARVGASPKTKADAKTTALIGPTLDTPHKAEPKKPEPRPESDARPKTPQPAPGSVEALMEAQLRAAAR